MSHTIKQQTSYRINNIIEGSYVVLILVSLSFIQLRDLPDSHTLDSLFYALINSRFYTAMNYVAGISFFYRIRKMTSNLSTKIRYLGLIIGSLGLVLIVTIGNIIVIFTAFSISWDFYK